MLQAHIASVCLATPRYAAALDNAQRIEVDPDELETQIVAGPVLEFPAAFTMSALFCAHHGLPVRSDFVSYIGSINETTEGRPLPADTFYFIHEPEWFKLDAQMGHCLILYCDPTRKQAIFFSQLFNMLGIAVIMPYEGSESICHTYGVDILEGKDVSVSVNTEMLRQLDWNATHILGDESLYAINQIRGNELMMIARQREFNRASEAIWAKHSDGKGPNTPMTRADRTAVYKDLCELIKKALPQDQVEQAISGLRQTFEKLGGVDD